MYSIYGGGRWREIDLETGRVSGWASSRFAYKKRGNLVVLNKKSVLRGLKNLSRGHISTVRDGLQLPQIIKKQKNQNYAQCKYEQPTFCVNPGTNIELNKMKPNQSNASVQCNTMLMKDPVQKNIQLRESMDRENSITSDSSIENNEKSITISESDVGTFRNFVVKNKKNIFNVNLLKYDEDDDYKRKIFYKISPIVHILRLPVILKLVQQKQFRMLISQLNSDKVSKQQQGNQSRIKEINSRSNGYNEPNNEIIEHDDDTLGGDVETSSNVKILKTINNQRKLQLNNEHNTVKRKDVNKIVPTDNLVTEHSSKEAKITKSVLENKSVHSFSNTENSKAKENSVKVHLIKTSTVSKLRTRILNEYSLIEDEAIVNWIIKNKKENLVNGNRIWKEMVPIHLQITGHSRSWHSLRNRYLRYILPTLGTLSLTPSQAASLRAAAATGEIKSKKNTGRNSIFSKNAAPVRSAWNARPQTRPRSYDEPSMPPRFLRSNIASPRKILSNSEITRRFAEKHQSTPYPEEEETNGQKSNQNKKQSKQTTTSVKKDKAIPIINLTRLILKKSRNDTNSEKEDDRARKIAKIDDNTNRKLTKEKNKTIVFESKHLRNINKSQEKLSKDKESPRQPRNKLETDTDEDIEKESAIETRNKNRSLRNTSNSRQQSGSRSQNPRQTRRKVETDTEEDIEKESAIETRNKNRSLRNTSNSRQQSGSRSQNPRQTRRKVETDTEEDIEKESAIETRNKNRSLRNTSNSRQQSGSRSQNPRQTRRKVETDTEEDIEKESAIETRNKNRSLRNTNNSRQQSGSRSQNPRQTRRKVETDTEEDIEKESAIETRNKNRSLRNTSTSRQQSGSRSQNPRQTRRKVETDTEEHMEKESAIETCNKNRSLRNTSNSWQQSVSRSQSPRQTRRKVETDTEEDIEKESAIETRNKNRSLRNTSNSRQQSVSRSQNPRQTRRKVETDTEEDIEKESAIETRNKNRSLRNTSNSRQQSVSRRQSPRQTRRKVETDTEEHIEKESAIETRNKNRSLRNTSNSWQQSVSRSQSPRQTRRKVETDTEEDIEMESAIETRNKNRSLRNTSNSWQQSVSRSQNPRQTRRKVETDTEGDIEKESVGRTRNKNRSLKSMSKNQVKSASRTENLRKRKGNDEEKENERQNTDNTHDKSRFLRNFSNSQENSAKERARRVDKDETYTKRKRIETQDIIKSMNIDDFDTDTDIGNNRRLIDTDSKSERQRKSHNVMKNTNKETKSKRPENSRQANAKRKPDKRKRLKSASESDSDFRSLKHKKENSKRVETDSDYSVALSQMSTSSDSDSDVNKRVTRHSNGSIIKSRDNIVFEISDDDEAYVSKSDTEKQIKKQKFRKLFNPKRL